MRVRQPGQTKFLKYRFQTVLSKILKLFLPLVYIFLLTPIMFILLFGIHH